MIANNKPLEVASYTTQLIGGVADGIRLVRFMGKSMVTLIVPRHRVKEAKGLPDVPPRGVYYLLDMKHGRPEKLYAGQTVQGVTRLESHLSGKAWWNYAVMFLASDTSLTKDVIDGLESAMIRHAQQFAFCQVDNGNNPSPNVSPYYEGLVLETHKELLWRMDVLGFCFSTESGLKPGSGERPVPRKKNPPFNFEEFSIANGAKLVFFDARKGISRPDITATVCAPRKIKYKGRATSISAVAKRIMKFKNNPRGPEYWTYNGRLLADIYREKYPAR